jgi:hypothetical protein
MFIAWFCPCGSKNGSNAHSLLPSHTPSHHRIGEWPDAPVVGSWLGTATNDNATVRRGMSHAAS